MAEETLPPTLQNILDQKSLKWIFCGTSPKPLAYCSLSHSSGSRVTGGKGGVGAPPHLSSSCLSCVTRYHTALGCSCNQVKPRPRAPLRSSCRKPANQSCLSCVTQPKNPSYLIRYFISQNFCGTHAYAYHSRPIPHTTCQMHSGKSSPKRRRK